MGRGPAFKTLDDKVKYLLKYKTALQPDGCLVYTNKAAPNGYAHFTYNSEDYYLHREVYRVIKGVFPFGYVRHTCDNPSCVNPNHLLFGKPVDNSRDRETRNRGNRIKNSRGEFSKH